MAENLEQRATSKKVGALGGLWPFIRPYRGMVIVAGLALCLTATVSLVLPMAVRRVVDSFGAGDVTLSNNATLSYVRATATTIANNISGTGNVSATITGASSDLTTNHTINLTGGTVNLVTDGNLSVTQAIRTTNSTSGAVFLPMPACSPAPQGKCALSFEANVPSMAA